MNHAYRPLFNRCLGTWVAAPETARSHGKAGRTVRAIVAAACAGLAAHAAALDSGALPAGGTVAAGSGRIATAGSTLTVSQASQKLVINWQRFDIGSNATVNFVQPDRSAIALNRVLGSDPSQIYGKLNANGQVFLLNPNGLLFGKGAEVNVGGLVASTLGLSDSDFLRGNYRFAGSAGTVLNQGSITATDGGYVALLGGQVSNQGTIAARLGAVALAAGSDLTLDFAGDGLISVTVNQGALNALAENKQLIQADGGNVLLSARAADRLIAAVVNNEGVIEARTVENRNGTIKLLGDMDNGGVQVGGTLDASAPTSGNGGFIETSAAQVKVAPGTTVTTRATKGLTGSWLIDPADYTIAAAGGDITGADLSNALATSNVTLLSSSGSTSGSGDINVNDAVAWSANTLTLTAARDININAVMTASGSSKLVMNTATANGSDGAVSGGTVKVGFNADGSFKGRVDFGSRIGSGFLTINGEGYTVINSLGADGSTTGTDLQGMNGNLRGNYALGSDIDASATSGWSSGQGFTTVGNLSASFTGKFDGLGHTVANLTINRPSTDYVGLFGGTIGATLRNVGLSRASISGHNNVGALVGHHNESSIATSYATGYVSGYYDVGGLVGRNRFSNISSSHANAEVSASFDVGGLTGYNDFSDISTSYAIGKVSGLNQVGGLVGLNFYSNISSSHATGEVSSFNYYIGGLVGKNYRSTIGTSHATGKVTGSGHVGGLVGSNDTDSSIGASYATGNVSGDDTVGGLAGSNKSNSQIETSYAAGNVIATETVGGLVGYNDSGSIGTSYATGAVSGTKFVGGLVGFNNSSIATSYTTGAVSGSTYVGGLVGYNYDGSIAASFWNTETTGQSGSAGGTGRTTAEMRQLSAYTATGWDIDATAGTGKTWRIYEGQTAPLLRTFLTSLTVTATSGSRTYDGSTGGLGVSYSTTPNGHLLGTALATTSSRNVGSSTVTASGLYSDQQGYDIAYASGTVDITQKTLTVSGITASDKVYDGTTNAAVSTSAVLLGGIVTGDDLTVSSVGAFADKNAGAGKTVNLINAYSGLDLGNYVITDQAATTATITPKSLTVSGITANDKVYDGTAFATISTAGATFSGLIAGDNLIISAAFTDKNVGSGKTVNLTYGGSNAGNYAITGQNSTASITPRSLTVSSITASDKVYDGTDSVSVSTRGVILSGLVPGDNLTFNSFGGSFADKNAGTGKTVNLINAFYGLDLGNYVITDQATTTASIIPKALSVSGITASDKIYDGTTSATVSTAGASLSGLVAGDSVTVSTTGTFGDKNVGTGKTVNLASTYGGIDVGNYAIIDQGTTIADITPRSLTVSGATAANKVYDGTTVATISDGRLAGVVSGDRVTLAQSGTFADKNAGALKTVTETFGISGADASNYVLANTTGTTTADITPSSLTVSGATAASKTYDGTTAAIVSGGTLSGVLGGDVVTLRQSGAFADKNVGIGKTITETFALGGADAGNYVLAGSTATTSADITPRTLSLAGLIAQDKTYDGTTSASASANLVGVAGGDNVGDILTASFSTASVGANKTVVVTAIALTGLDAGNYRIAPGQITSASIRAYSQLQSIIASVQNPPSVPKSATPSVDAGKEGKPSSNGKHLLRALIPTFAEMLPGMLQLIGTGMRLPAGLDDAQ